MREEVRRQIEKEVHKLPDDDQPRVGYTYSDLLEYMTTPMSLELMLALRRKQDVSL